LAQLVDLAAVGVVEVLHALLSMGAFKIHVCSGGLALGGQRCQGAAQVGCHHTSSVKVCPGSRKLALHLLDRCVTAIGTLRLRLCAALGRASTPFSLGPGLLLSLGSLDHRITLLLELPQLRPCGLNVRPQLRSFGLGLLPVGRGSRLNLGEL
jgi:hypothetical protein